MCRRARRHEPWQPKLHLCTKSGKSTLQAFDVNGVNAPNLSGFLSASVPGEKTVPQIERLHRMSAMRLAYRTPMTRGGSSSPPALRRENGWQDERIYHPQGGAVARTSRFPAESCREWEKLPGNLLWSAPKGRLIMKAACSCLRGTNGLEGNAEPSFAFWIGQAITLVGKEVVFDRQLF